MADVLKGPAVGPDGDRFKAGQKVPSHWPDWYIADLRAFDHIVEAAAPKASPHKGTAAAKKRTARKAAK